MCGAGRELFFLVVRWRPEVLEDRWKKSGLATSSTRHASQQQHCTPPSRPPRLALHHSRRSLCVLLCVSVSACVCVCPSVCQLSLSACRALCLLRTLLYSVPYCSPSRLPLACLQHSSTHGRIAISTTPRLLLLHQHTLGLAAIHLRPCQFWFASRQIIPHSDHAATQSRPSACAPTATPQAREQHTSALLPVSPAKPFPRPLARRMRRHRHLSTGLCHSIVP
jgi:hypothetical protein